MKQWEIWTCDFADAGPHPAVIVSHPDRVARAPLVNVLIASSQKAGRPGLRSIIQSYMRIRPTKSMNKSLERVSPDTSQTSQ